jgi:small subunit ribosomal protein S6
LEIASTTTRNLPTQVRTKPTLVGFGFLSRRIYSATSPYPNFFLEIHQARCNPKERRCLLLYELMYIARPTLDEQALATLNDKVTKFIATAGGQVLKREDWGKRRLAYPIAKCTEGFYSVLQIQLPPTAVRTLENNLKLAEDVLRHLIVKVEPHLAPDSESKQEQ